MIQVLCSHRHGSTLYCNYTKSKHDLKFVRVYDSGPGKFGDRSSFFQMKYKIDGSNDIKYINDYEVHILNRNPWDVFLSYSYQSLQQFKIAHRLRDTKNNLAPVETEFLITDDLLSHWLQKYSEYKSSVKWLCDNGTFKYKVIDYDMFKDIEVFKTLPMGLDYKKLCLNYDEVKNKFPFPDDINSIL